MSILIQFYAFITHRNGWLFFCSYFYERVNHKEWRLDWIFEWIWVLKIYDDVGFAAIKLRFFVRFCSLFFFLPRSSNV
jgi:hypothetical protein